MEISLEMEELKRRELEQAWNEICPPLYQATVATHAGMPQEALRALLAWEPNRDGNGVGMVGDTGHGKTRCMFLLLKQLHFGGYKVGAITAKRFENLCSRMFDKDDDARVTLKQIRTVPTLLIDDVGKEKYTERVESEFYDLIETRTSHLRPTLWTSNANGDQIASMMSADRGRPIVRRLREFSEIISV